jgi:hypothetical protein
MPSFCSPQNAGFFEPEIGGSRKSGTDHDFAPGRFTASQFSLDAQLPITWLPSDVHDRDDLYAIFANAVDDTMQTALSDIFLHHPQHNGIRTDFF